MTKWQEQSETERRKREAAGTLVFLYAEGKPESGSPVPEHIQQILKDAVAAGYDVFPGHSPQNKRTNPAFLQKCIRKDSAKLYFIHIELWDLRREFSDYTHGADLQFKVQFYRRETHQAVDVEPHVISTDTLASMEAFFAQVYETLGCEPYEDNG